MFHVELIKKTLYQSCPLCDSEKLDVVFECTDFFLSKEKFNIVKCNTCFVLFTNPQPQKDAIKGYYKTEKYISHSNTDKGLTSKVYKTVRKLAIKRKYGIIKTYKNRGSIIDIGCGTGHLLNHFRKKGWKTFGIEPDPSAREFAKSNFNIVVEEENELENCKENSFDVVSMWHVLEHVHKPIERMDLIYKILKNDGIAVIALPNFEAYDAKYYKIFWAAWDVPRHLYHFNKEAFCKIANNSGFNVFKLMPMKFDALYVSLLSEEYASGKKKFIPAIYRGIISNIKAAGNPAKYSSIIYMLKKT